MDKNKIHPKKIITAGVPLKGAKKVLIMIHGRGGRAEDILSLSNFLNVKDFALLAPQARDNTWYPYSFLAPVSQNEPWLSSALALVKETLDEIIAEGISSENVYLLGFSQGACLTLEFAARNATKFGGIVAFTGGLIGDRIDRSNYVGDFKSTSVFIGSSNPDPHVPVARVDESVEALKDMNADVIEKIYNGMGHTISEDEIELANELVFNV
jgi:phospholipase/carboxylesterase